VILRVSYINTMLPVNKDTFTSSFSLYKIVFLWTGQEIQTRVPLISGAESGPQRALSSPRPSGLVTISPE
jgi:hypothetical protein